MNWRRDLAILLNWLRMLGRRDAFCIVDLSPGDGERAWQLLRVLRDASIPCRYLALCRTDAIRSALEEAPGLGDFRSSGELSTSTWPPDIEGWRRLLPQQGAPFLVFAHDLFSELAHGLFACHYGQWMEPFQGENESKPEWRAVADPDTHIRDLAPVYLRGMNSGSFLLPNGAITLLAQIEGASESPYLVVAGDIGVGDLGEIRLGGLHVPFDVWQSAARLPVNFHAIAHWHADRGGQCAHRCDAPDGRRMLQIAMHNHAWPDAADRLSELLETCVPIGGESEALIQLGAALAQQIDADLAATGQAFPLWKSSGYSPKLLLGLEAPLLEQASVITGAATCIWRQALHESCCQHYPGPEDCGFYRSAAKLAATLGRWAWAFELLHMDGMLYGESVEAVRFQAHCLEMCGGGEHALELLEQALLACEGNADLRDHYVRLHQRLQQWDTLPWYAADLATLSSGTAPLKLEPLGPEHAAEFFYQYRDPQIGMMARLPEFESIEAVVAWIETRHQESGRMDYALMHGERGFAGVISAHRVARNAFFHFWIGADFQGQGLATPAFELLRKQLERLRIRRIFTTVYPDNFRSLRVIERCGFRLMPDRALPPEENMPFYCLEIGSAVSTAEENSVALRDYCTRSGGVFVFSTLLEGTLKQAEIL